MNCENCQYCKYNSYDDNFYCDNAKSDLYQNEVDVQKDKCDCLEEKR